MLFVFLGNDWMERNRANTVNRRYYTSAIMRLMARLLIVLRSVDKGNKDLADYISPGSYGDLVNATMTVSGVDVFDDECFGAASNAIKLKYDLMRVANIKIVDAIINKDDTARKDGEDFLYVIKHRWSNNLARVALMRRRLNAKIPLPEPNDIKKLATYLNEKLKAFDRALPATYSNYRHAIQLVLAKLISFNRRRCGEVQATL